MREVVGCMGLGLHGLHMRVTLTGKVFSSQHWEPKTSCILGKSATVSRKWCSLELKTLENEKKNVRMSVPTIAHLIYSFLLHNAHRLCILDILIFPCTYFYKIYQLLYV